MKELKHEEKREVEERRRMKTKNLYKKEKKKRRRVKNVNPTVSSYSDVKEIRLHTNVINRHGVRCRVSVFRSHLNSILYYIRVHIF